MTTWVVIRESVEHGSTVWLLAVCTAQIMNFLGKHGKVFDFTVLAHRELWIIGAPGIVLNSMEWWGEGLGFMLIFSALNLYTWWITRDWPDENRWKRRGRKAREAIAERAGRLVVVPEGSA